MKTEMPESKRVHFHVLIQILLVQQHITMVTTLSDQTDFYVRILFTAGFYHKCNYKRNMGNLLFKDSLSFSLTTECLV